MLAGETSPLYENRLRFATGFLSDFFKDRRAISLAGKCRASRSQILHPVPAKEKKGKESAGAQAPMEVSLLSLLCVIFSQRLQG
jgi:hypothetical protein